jgi:hypothetical protein
VESDRLAPSVETEWGRPLERRDTDPVGGELAAANAREAPCRGSEQDAMSSFCTPQMGEAGLADVRLTIALLARCVPLRVHRIDVAEAARDQPEGREGENKRRSTASPFPDPISTRLSSIARPAHLFQRSTTVAERVDSITQPLFR